ncbi:MAG: DNA polymerase III subunit chi [Syntrophobacteraceae bacterium]|nr:DNA polymerase III subunit chi [Syntrophobacteraceae bacterium]
MSTIYFVETTTGEQRDFLCRWTDRFFSERKRVRIVVDSMAAAQLIDQLLWTFSQQSFMPHAIFNPRAARPEEPVLITLGQFLADGFEALVCDSQSDLEFMGLFETTVHFILGDDLERKQQSRVLWQRARDSGLNPIHVPYERKR